MHINLLGDFFLEISDVWSLVCLAWCCFYHLREKTHSEKFSFQARELIPNTIKNFPFYSLWFHVVLVLNHKFGFGLCY